ncbi:MAG TPA: hypothetical protein VLT33_35390 [Labilithrix sp.]|nr:hypothetical protein [Labilithrix sp.]
MIDSSSRADARSCRLPGDDDDREPAATPVNAGQSEKPRLACALDIDWDEPNASHTPPSVFGPPAPTPLPPATTTATQTPGPAAPPKQATNNATRTSERDLDAGPYAAAGYSKESEAFYAGVAAIKGRTASGVEVEVLSASVQVGAQNEAQATGIRLGASNAHGAVSVEAATANAHAGFYNPDGSVGLNGGAQASTLYAEGTLSGAANSVTAGVGAGSGAEASIGVRDKDRDDNPEVCFRVAAGFLMVGACIEIPFHGKM